MKRAWHPDQLAQCWTLNPDELELLGNKTGVTRLRFAVLLKAFQFDGRFPDRRADVAGSVAAHLASQIGVSAEAYFDGEWSERTQRHQRAQIRKHFGFRPFRARVVGNRFVVPAERLFRWLFALSRRVKSRQCADHRVWLSAAIRG